MDAFWILSGQKRIHIKTVFGGGTAKADFFNTLANRNVISSDAYYLDSAIIQNAYDSVFIPYSAKHDIPYAIVREFVCFLC